MSKAALVISAHLDDAILSAGQFIAGRAENVDVLTIFSGIPMKKDLLTAYDESCGFKTSKDAMVIRQQEDQEACAILNARPIHTDNLDSQYTSKKQDWLADVMELITMRKYELILAPLGLIHPDHIAVSNGLRELMPTNLYLYEDLPHRVIYPEHVWERLRGFPGAKLTFIGDGNIADKVRALWCYRSQIGRGDLNPYYLYVPERFYKV